MDSKEDGAEEDASPGASSRPGTTAAMQKQQADVGERSASPAFQGRIVKQMAKKKI